MTPSDLDRRSFLFESATLPAALLSGVPSQGAPKEFQYESLRWVEEAEDPSVTLETRDLIVKVIDNTGLRSRPVRFPSGKLLGSPLFTEPSFSHMLGYQGIRALWRKDESRNIVAPFVSWLNLQQLRIEGVELDPVDSRAVGGVGRGWPVRMERETDGIALRIPRMPVSGVEYLLSLKPSGNDSLDFEVRFTLHKKTRSKASFYASWPCYMATYDEVALYSPQGNPESPDWVAFGEKEPLVVGHPIDYVHHQRFFEPRQAPALPAAYGRIGSRVFALMMSRPEVRFFVVNRGGYLPFSPIQNPAWDFRFELPDYEPGKPFGFRGHLLYAPWTGPEELLSRYRAWKAGLR